MARNSRREHLKTAQLCAQVGEALSLALGAIDDDVILGLHVLEVVPAPDSSRLQVWLGADEGSSPDEVLERLARYEGRLRLEVAASIHRKKTPSLVFRIGVPGLDHSSPGPDHSGA